ncbi:MAG TPA: polyphosphate kinase 2 [Alphaproteobacteria bacterium]|nr:polyphosphate kinase 2 [Alphaproteobacteria bacterium]
MTDPDPEPAADQPAADAKPKLKRKDFERELDRLQHELVVLQEYIKAKGLKVVVIFEGRDAAGKGGVIKRITERTSPRAWRIAALAAPTERERTQWYFQRYVAHLPAAGEVVLFDRSWYNRAGVERVMGFCNADQLADFLREAPQFEGMLMRDGMRLFKFYLDIGREMQWKRFHERRHDPLKSWKITDIDLAAIGKWDEYTKAKDDIFRFTHTPESPWTVIRANDQRRTRIEAIRTVLAAIDYEGKSKKIVGAPDPRIVGSGPEFFHAG